MCTGQTPEQLAARESNLHKFCLLVLEAFPDEPLHVAIHRYIDREIEVAKRT